MLPGVSMIPFTPVFSFFTTSPTGNTITLLGIKLMPEMLTGMMSIVERRGCRASRSASLKVALITPSFNRNTVI